MLKTFPTTGPQVVQGPGENAGVLRLPDGWAVAFKIESHNHPSAVEPYQGAATGVGGILRDVFTMGARPVAMLNSLRFGPLDQPRNRYLFAGVVRGVGDYGNCVGVPTLGGEVAFAPGYSGNPLVNAMCVGLLREDDLIRAAAHGVGNVLLGVGARTGRDGIHGASFASEELSEKSEARRPQVQVGDPFTEKLLLEASLELITSGLIVAIQDMGAAGPHQLERRDGRARRRRRRDRHRPRAHPRAGDDARTRSCSPSRRSGCSSWPSRTGWTRSRRSAPSGSSPPRRSAG